ncbi:hypothetical protein FRC02_008627 [Tulasnella sp. 418]|nr:hypothetical protein FRC02_008627 [Tulasnella sp. 418]
MPYYPSRWGQGVFLRSTVESAKARILTINADSEEIKKLWDEEEAYLVQRKPVIDEYNWAYSTWEKQHIGYRSDAIAQNQDRWYHEAERAGWTQADARKSLSLKELLKTKKRLNAFMTDDDWEFYFPRISAEIDQIRIKRESLELEHKRQQHRQAVIDFLNKLKSRPATYRDFPIHLPSPDVFRKLPVVESFEQNTEIKWLSKKLEQKDITVAIKGDLEKWLARMRKVFADKLGFKAKDVALLGKEVLHPTERLTALFECKKCGKNGRIYDQSGGSLTFHEVVAHVCPKYAVKNEKERKWDLAKFTVDKVAVEVVREAIRIGGWDEAKSTKKRIAKDGTRFECKECGLNMVFDCLVGHAKRHLQTSPVGKSDDGRTPQEIPAGGLKTTTNEIPPERIIEAGTEVPPLRFSLSKYSAFDSKPKPYPNLELLMMDIPQYNGLRQKPIYYCLHCPEEVRKKRKGYTINGLRLHLGTLHKVKTLRSEDFFGEEQKPAKENKVHSTNEQMARQQGDMNESERMLAWLMETTGDGNVHAEVEPQQHAL